MVLLILGFVFLVGVLGFVAFCGGRVERALAAHNARRFRP